MVTDLDTGAVLAARDPHGRYQPASVLKLLAGLVMLPHLPGARVITATAEATNAEGSAVGLVPGGRYTVDTLFKSLYLMSGNDAAMALALANGGPARTVAEMNAYARRLGAYDTVVQTPSGLDGWTQLTSAYDLTLVLRAAVNTPRLLAYDEARTARLPAQKVGKHKWGGVPLFNESDNFFTTVPGALLAKTGFTGAAQHTYVCAAARGGRRIGVVFLRNQRRPVDQYLQAGALLNWAFALPRTTVAVGHLGAVGNAPKPSPTAAPTAGGKPVLTPTATPSRGARLVPAGQRHAEGWPSGPLWVTVAVLAAFSFVARAYGRRRRRVRRHR
jgi:D-alanyl-D-alanine carboxypeptidase (penicillin-binding protein 5/6)